MPERTISAYSIIFPNTSFYSFTAQKSTIFFEFLNPEEIKLLLKSNKRTKTTMLTPRVQ